MRIIYLILFLCVAVLVQSIYTKKRNVSQPNILQTKDQPEYTVYCLMITGYTPDRIAYAKASVTNFLDQSYKHKHLILLNQSEENIIDSQNIDNVIEVHVAVDKIGVLRNKSIDMVPDNTVWTTWDDDDFRHPDYLSIFMEEFKNKDVDFLMFQNRFEYNILTNYMFKIKLKSGTMIFFSKRENQVRYDPVSTMEDQVVKKYAKKHLRYKIIDNDPKLYIRLIHNNNTSLYVDKDKRTLRDTKMHVDYFETEPTPCEIEYLTKIISSYY